MNFPTLLVIVLIVTSPLWLAGLGCILYVLTAALEELLDALA